MFHSLHLNWLTQINQQSLLCSHLLLKLRNIILTLFQLSLILIYLKYIHDFTLWDVQVDKCNPPFHKESDSVLDEKGTIIKLYPDVLNILKLLKKHEFPLSIASRITDISSAYQLINLFNLNGYFDHLEIYPTNKTLHFSRLQEKTNIKFENMMFFDDDLRNIRDINKLGVICHLVENGLNKNVLEPLFNSISSKNQAVNLIENKIC